MRSDRVVVACTFAVAFGVVAVGLGQGQAGRFAGVELSIEPVSGSVYMVQRPGGGGNVGVFVGAEGVLLVDSLFAPLSEKLVAAVRSVSPSDIRFLINTHTNTIAWRSPTIPLPMENDPRALFERMFGTAISTDPAVRLARIRRDRSILDSVTEKASALRLQLPPGDQTKLNEYLEAIRDVERRLQKAEEQSDQEVPLVDQPAGIPRDFAEHSTLMVDLLALAYQTDLTRVSTFMIGREISSRPYPEIGIPDSHHPLSHHENDPRRIDDLGKVNLYHMEQFSHFVENLSTTPDGDGSLLDQSLLVYGAGISDSNTHFHDNLPIALVGGSAAGLKGGRHIRYPDDTPVTNLWMTLLDKMGVPAEKLGDSTGHVEHLWDI